MKWIKKFEELSPSIYRNAGKKLIYIGHSERGFGMIDHSYKIEHGVSNMWYCNQGEGVINATGDKVFEPFPFSFEKSVLTYNTNSIPLKTSNSSGFTNDIDVDNYVEEYGMNVNFGFNLEFYFAPTSATVKKLKLKTLNSYNLFNIRFTIDGSENKDGGVKVTINGLGHFDDSDHYDDYFGIFSDRKGAQDFLRKVLPNEIEKHTDEILSIFTLTEISTTTYNDRVLEVSNKIKINNLYRTEIPYNVDPNSNTRHGHIDNNKLFHFLFTKNDITK